MRDYTSLSALSVLNETVALQVQNLEEQIEQTAQDLSIFTAEGLALDSLVVDRLLDGRYPGDYATGELTFSRSTPAGEDISIPVGTICTSMSETGEGVRFVTTVAGMILTGDETDVVEARCLVRGLTGNTPAYTISFMNTPIQGVEAVRNVSDFAGGTLAETDDELRDRYIYSVTLPGKATTTMIEEHLDALEDVLETYVWNRGSGDIEIVTDYVNGIADDSDDIGDSIEENIAAGIVARGLLAAILGAANIYELGDSYGGKIWVRPLEHITSGEDIELTYTDTLDRVRTATVSVAAVAIKGTAIEATLQDTDDRAVEITASDYAGSFSYDVLIGMGVYPYLYNLPEHEPVSIIATLKLTETPESDLIDNIKASVEAFLDSMKIGGSLEFSDLLNYVYSDYLTGRGFVGIDIITSLIASGVGMSISSLGDEIDIEDDSRLESGTVTINIV